MPRYRRGIAALLLIILCFSAAACAEDTIEVSLARGERWPIPEERFGSCEIVDTTVVALEGSELVGLKPGRTEVRISGRQDTLLRVLVLFTEAAPDPDAEAAEPTVHPDYRYFTVSDTDEDEDASGESPAPAPTPTPQTTARNNSLKTEKPEAAPVTTQPESDVKESESAETPAPQAASSDITVQSYDRSAVPDAINTVIDFALDEWRAADNKTFSRAGSKNKYSYWQCGKGPKCNIGWCGAFLGYVFDTCGVPMDEPTKSVPHESGEPYSVHAAGVGKINKGFENMKRLSSTPQPGYLVIYGEQKAYGYKHIGLVTDVDDLGGGVYLLKTVEGNMSNRIKRFCYLYDTNESLKNTKPCPAEYRRTDGEINDYEHIKKWRITTFCQTWF